MTPRTSVICPGVLIVDNFLSGQGGHAVSEELAARLSDAGWPVLTTSPRRARLPRLLDMLGAAIRLRGQYRLAVVAVYSGLAFRLTEAVCWTLRRLGRPYVLVLHGGSLPDFARHSPERVRRLLVSAAAVTAPSRYLIEELRAYRADIHLLPNPIDLSAFAFRRRDEAKPALIWLRAFHPLYHPALAVEAAALLAAEWPDVHLTMIGPDKGEGALEQARADAARLKIVERIDFVGPVSRAEVPIQLAKGDIFLNTTTVDNTPLSVIEALACGLCIVSTDVGGLPYLLTHEHDALLVPSGDAAAMAAAVRRLLTEPELAERLSRNARATAEKLDWSRVLPQWEALLAGIAPL